jgi:hypothetical protein
MCNPVIATRVNNMNIKNFSQVQIGTNENIKRHYEDAHSFNRDAVFIKSSSHENIKVRTKTNLAKTLQLSSQQSNQTLNRTLQYQR